MYVVGESSKRPWGSWVVLAVREKCVVKSIVVTPNQRLSLQSHNHRSEVWTVAEGEAIVTLDDKELVVKAGESVSIPVGVKHRLENKSRKDLCVIELQFGDLLSEDDIIRYSDDYNRVPELID